MRESDYYAPGTYNNPLAPWNQEETPEREFNTKAEFSLIKSTSIESNQYYIEEDPDGSYIETDIDWYEEYKKQHYTPLELIEKFKEYLTDTLSHTEDKHKQQEIKYLIAECEGWDEEFNDAYEDK